MMKYVVTIDSNLTRQLHAAGIVRLSIYVHANIDETLEDLIKAV